ncbi:hypothetical protein LIER_05492 [Lithospermum erythrorhizon]|uniref:Uncharacterized protein n=1 Tax=Lithospermum erythrorhizon TaxID=34254 RepID=A0AAV3P3E8_LITER
MLSNTWYHHGLQVELCDSELIDVYGSKLTCCSSNTGPLLDLGFRLTLEYLLVSKVQFTPLGNYKRHLAASQIIKKNLVETSVGPPMLVASLRIPPVPSHLCWFLVAFNKKVYLVALN